MKPTLTVLAVALVAGLAGVAAGLWINGPGPLLDSDLGQRALKGAMDASAPAPPADLKIAERGGIVPTFRLPDRNGTAVTLPGDYAGRPVLVNLWASWCGPCIKEMPELDRYAASQGAQGVQVVGIALDDPAAVEAFLTATPVKYPILLDLPGPRDAGVRLGNRKGILPYTALIDAQGRLMKEKIGPFEPGEIDSWVE